MSRDRRLVVAAFFLLLLGLLATAPAHANRIRDAAFNRAATFLRAAGRADDARALLDLGAIGPVMPRALETAEDAATASATGRYARLREKLTLFLLARGQAHHDRNLHRAEAALHLVSLIIDGDRSSLSSRFLDEADLALRLAGTPPPRRVTSAPEIELSATPASIRAGEAALVRWRVSGADRVRLNGRAVATTSEETRRPTESEYLHLVATGEGGEADASLWLRVTSDVKSSGPMPSASLIVHPTRIVLGESVTLSWNARHGETILLDGVPVPPTDSKIVFPTTSGRYRLTVEAAGGRAQAVAPIYVFRPSRGGDVPRDRTPIALETLTIRFDGLRPLPPHREELGRIAASLKSTPSARLVIEGHADNAGRAAANRRLSLDRALLIRQILIDEHQGDPDRIEAIGFGSDRPAASNATAAGRRLNRRVEIQWR
jgi:outer membrane protein OmpA-like peptidoglycan-associated protein